MTGAIAAPRWLWLVLGTDADRLVTLLRYRIALDERRGRQALATGVGTPLSGGLLLTCALHAMFGIMSGLLFVVLPDEVLATNALVQLGVLTFTTMVLVGDYAPVVLDDTDVAVVAPLPVDDRTFFLSRVVHIAVYLSLIVGSLAFPPLVVGSFVHGPWIFAPVFVVSTVLTTGLALGLAFGTFLLAARLMSPDRFRRSVVLLQVGAMVVFIAGPQILPGLLDHIDLEGILSAGWIWLLPPVHQGGLLALALGDAAGGRNVALAVLAIVVPSLMILAMLWLSSRGLVAGLAARAADRDSPRDDATLRAPRRWIGGLLRDRNARAGYDFFCGVSRETQFRMRVFPPLALAAVFGIMPLVRGGAFGHPAMMCLALYFLAASSTAFVLATRYSENPEARWLLRALPVDGAGRFVGGVMIGLMTRIVLPATLALAAGIVAVGGVAVLPDVLLAAAAVAAIVPSAVRLLGARMPFTEPFSKRTAEGNVAVALGGAMVGATLGGVHYPLRGVPWGREAAAAVLLWIAAVQLRGVLRLRVRF